MNQLSDQAVLELTETASSRLGKPWFRVSVVVGVTLLLGTVIAVIPGQFRRSVIICNGSPNELLIDKVIYAAFNTKSAQLDEHVLDQDLKMPANSTIQFPNRSSFHGYAQVTLSDGQRLLCGFAFGWGESDILTYSPTGIGYSRQQSTLKYWFERAAMSFPALNRFR